MVDDIHEPDQRPALGHARMAGRQDRVGIAVLISGVIWNFLIRHSSKPKLPNRLPGSLSINVIPFGK
jgi:hypothetical protein